MSEERERRERWLARRAYQRAQDRALAGSTAARTALETAWRPIEQFITGGPDVGEREEIESEGGQRIN